MLYISGVFMFLICTVKMPHLIPFFNVVYGVFKMYKTHPLLYKGGSRGLYVGFESARVCFCCR